MFLLYFFTYDPGFSSKIYHKHDELNFKLIDSPFLDGKVPLKMVFISCSFRKFLLLYYTEPKFYFDSIFVQMHTLGPLVRINKCSFSLASQLVLIFNNMTQTV